MGPARKRIGLVCSEPLRETMAGIGIRYFEMARHLSREGFGIELLHPGQTPEALTSSLPGVVFETYCRSGLAQLAGRVDVVVAQGQLANDVAVALPDTPKVFDFYDPWLIENLAYADTLGWEAFYNDLASWRLQFETGDFFICSSQVQRQFYLGFLTALGRVHPDGIAGDPTLLGLIDVVPFGIADEIPAYRPYLPPRANERKRILFGGLYDWYDPWTLLDALAILEDQSWEVLFVANPNQETTPQKLAIEVKQWAEEKGWLGQRLKFLEWVPLDRRYDLVRDADVMVAPHTQSLETHLCMRTRYLDAIGVGCPVISSEGGTISELLGRYGAGEVVPCGEPRALALALEDILWNGRDFGEGLSQLRKKLSWRVALQPLVNFCQSPKLDPAKKLASQAKQGRSMVQRVLARLRRLWQ